MPSKDCPGNMLKRHIGVGIPAPRLVKALRRPHSVAPFEPLGEARIGARAIAPTYENPLFNETPSETNPN